MGVSTHTPALFKRVQKVKADMLATQHNASPGQVVMSDTFFTEIYNTVLDLEQEAFGDQKGMSHGVWLLKERTEKY